MRKLVESGDENQKLFTKYIVKTARLIHNYTDTSPLNELNFILDFEGLSIEQFASIPSEFGHNVLILQGRKTKLCSYNKFRLLNLKISSFIAVTYTLGLGLQHRNLLEAGRVNKIYLINGKGSPKFHVVFLYL